MSAPDIRLRAYDIWEFSIALMERTKDDGVHAAACSVAESADHLFRGAPDPKCEACGVTPGPSDDGFGYDTDDGCPSCGSDEYALFSWATSLVHLTEDLVREAMTTADDPNDLGDAIVLSGKVKQLTALYGSIKTIIRTVREAGSEEGAA